MKHEYNKIVSKEGCQVRLMLEITTDSKENHFTFLCCKDWVRMLFASSLYH